MKELTPKEVKRQLTDIIAHYTAPERIVFEEVFNIWFRQSKADTRFRPLFSEAVKTYINQILSKKYEWGEKKEMAKIYYPTKLKDKTGSVWKRIDKLDAEDREFVFGEIQAQIEGRQRELDWLVTYFKEHPLVQSKPVLVAA